jgi:N-acetylglucosaminyl-diphospho-decaprenol L-rhamnosyltransferase
MTPTVRVIAVTYSPGELLDRLLDSLPDACSVPYEVVLADNGSADGAPERAARRTEVQLLRTGTNVGYGTAANLGAADARTPYLLICNPDLLLAPKCVDLLLDAADRHVVAGAFGPMISEPDGTLYPSARALPSLRNGIGHGLLANVWPGNPWSAAYRRDREDVREREAGWLSGSCLLVRRSAFEDVGGFDPGYFMYFEDVDLCDRLAKHGWSCLYVPTASVVHVGGTATGHQPRRMLKAHHDSAYRYLASRYPPPVTWLAKAGLAVRYRILSRRMPRDVGS